MRDLTSQGSTATYAITGMDCAGCAAKVRGAVERLPGVVAVDLTVLSGRLTVELAPGAEADKAIATTVRRLGFGVSDACAPVDVDLSAPRPWYLTAKARLVGATGALLTAAFAIDLAGQDGLGELAFAIACLVGLVPIARRALTALAARQPFTIEMLMTIAATGALVIGAAGEAAVVVFLFAVGELLEGIAAGQARAGIKSLASLVPRTAQLEQDGVLREVQASDLRVGDVVVVRPGDRAAADGIVLDGISAVDESPVTGESMPRHKTDGDPLFAGSINGDGVLRIRVSRDPEDNTIARIIRLVLEAERARAPTERFIDRFSRVYMPVVVGAALVVATVPPLALDADWQTWIYRALALLLIGCPCALVISVPAAIAAALATGTRRGLLLKGGAVLEATADASIVAFDKTGTLTEGRPVVTDIEAVDVEPDAVLAAAAAVEASASHPVAQAIRAMAEARGIEPATATAARAIPGLGVEAIVDGRCLAVGSARYATQAGVMAAEQQRRIRELEADGKTVVCLFAATERRMLGILAVRDEPRADAAAAIQELRSLDVEPIMLSGDNARTAAVIAGRLGVAHQAELLPEDKVAALRELGARGRVVMVGDGINDAPALAAAQVGIAMGSGTDVALETADGALLRNRVGDVAATVRLARATMANIHQNVAIALGLKAVFLVTSLVGVTGLWLAILADTGATVLVTLNALRLLRFDPTGTSTQHVRGAGPEASTAPTPQRFGRKAAPSQP